ncbi:AsmA-like C-terminal region-containing protein [Aquimarina sp. U1-2]|uniref:AsmA-like C-terminal region-containing protein n=1 Tax=Aquimarina sp. U1-2 TaxID=2823141 RepID=UPI001AECFE14|nr:AsmA-like C-terminal region-containing protein [Aquimarina sp. U1-2]MBP2832459.1 AsmA-like C-terminal region-containing protein [Aquimarina sp. U1-2]
MKKALKIFGIIVLLLIISLISIPFLFKGTLQDKVRHLVNEHVNAKVDFADIHISLLRSFPQASVVIDDLSIINYAPFEGDTLAYSKTIALDMSVNELFKSANEAISVQKIVIDQAVVHIKIDSLGSSNYDITKTSETTPQSNSVNEENGDFTFSLEHYEINDSNITYKDEGTQTLLEMQHFNHSGDGSVSGDKVILDTHTDTDASFGFDNVRYLDKNKLQLDAQLELDLKNQKYAFKENKALLNRLPLQFTGFVQLFDQYTDVDLSFETPTSEFKNFLAVIPEAYAKNLDGVQTTGDFSIAGSIQGKTDETRIPTLDIAIQSQNASFKYPDLPKGVSNILIDVFIKNETGLANDTFIAINHLNFNIGEDNFAAQGTLKNLIENVLVDMRLKGLLHLENLEKAYPLDLDQELNGIVTADLTSNFDMQSLEKERYQNVKSSGSAMIKDFTYASPELPNTLNVSTAQINFKPGTISLEQLEATTGTSDISATGTIANLMGFLFAKQDLKGNFDVQSNVFSVNDFMIAETETEQPENQENKSNPATPATAADETMRIPSFLDATLNFDTQKVVYDNLQLSNTKGTVTIKDETAYLQNVTSTIFNGGLAFNGDVSTKSKVPVFNMALDLNQIDIVQSFNNLELVKGLAPIARALTGNLTTQINLNGRLNENLTPVLTSLKGKALAEILNAQVSTTKTPLLSKLDSRLNFIDLDKLNLETIKTNLSFDDGKINVTPFDFVVKGIKITAGGSHSFDQSMNYNVSLDIPAKYLGNETSGLISQLSEQEANTMTVSLPIGITGNFTNPKVDLELGSAVKNLTQQIIAKQKDKAKDKIKDKGGKVLSDLLGSSTKKNDSATTTKTKPEETLKNTARNILGGFLGRKKKKDSTKTKN